MAAGQGSDKAVSSGGEDKTEGAGAAPPTGRTKTGADSEAGLGRMLADARETRGLSRADVVAETRIPAHYLQMIESSDYGLISDQLYLLPFVRRYSAFLGLDGEEIAMRFVREVQRSEGAPPARMSEPLVLADGKRTRWGRLIAATAVLATVVVLYFLAAHRRHLSFQGPQATHAQRAASPLRAPDTSVVANPSGATGPAASRTEPPAQTTSETAEPHAASGGSLVRSTHGTANQHR